MDNKCPSEDATARAFPEEYACPACGTEVEIWSDEKQATCSSCKGIVKSSEAEVAGCNLSPLRSKHDAS